jgi:hypothetical protein
MNFSLNRILLLNVEIILISFSCWIFSQGFFSLPLGT